MSEEKELLRSKTLGFFNSQPIVLTDKHLVLHVPYVGERSIDLDNILEVYAKQGTFDSKMVMRLKDGTVVECDKIAPETHLSVSTFLGGSITDQGLEMRGNFKATTDRWVNLINRLLKRG